MNKREKKWRKGTEDRFKQSFALFPLLNYFHFDFRPCVTLRLGITMCIMIQPSAVQREQNVAEEQPTMTATCAGTNKNAVFGHVYALGPRLF